MAGVLQFLALGILAIAPGSVRAQCASLPTCTLLWADEFPGTAVDTTKWEFMIGNGSAYGIPAGWGNNELQYYTTNNATVANGELTITARQQAAGGLNYTSSRLRTKNRGDWTYGRFEMRAKLPTGQGLWPAFWMLPTATNYGGWAASGEIDIMESKGQNPTQIFSTLHYGGQSPANTFSGSSSYLPAGTAGNYHTYAIEWQNGEIRWYIDGQLVSTQNSWYSTAGPYPAPFDVNFHLLLNFAVGGNFVGSPNGSTVFPATYVIDYVRVYGSPAGQPTGQLVFDDMEHGNPFANGWFAFNGTVGGGGLDPNSTDLPPANGGSKSLQTGWGSGGSPGYFGGFGRTRPMDITGMTHFSFWINPDPGQDYVLEFNIQDDDNGDGIITPVADDEFQYNCHVGPSGPCAISGGGWQQVSVPLSSFTADNSNLYGGNDILDTKPVSAGGNGQMIQMVVAVISNSGADASFRTDYWVFKNLTDTDGDGVLDYLDNCTLLANPTQVDSDNDGFGNRCDGDLNNNGATNAQDTILFRQQLGQPSTPPTYNIGDLNGNGAVNAQDTALFRQLLGQPPGPSGLVP